MAISEFTYPNMLFAPDLDGDRYVATSRHPVDGHEFGLLINPYNSDEDAARSVAEYALKEYMEANPDGEPSCGKWCGCETCKPRKVVV